MDGRESIDPRIRLRIAVRDLSPDERPDDFAETVAALCAIDPEAASAIGQRFDLARSVIRDWARGATTPAPGFRREVAAFLRERGEAALEAAAKR